MLSVGSSPCVFSSVKSARRQLWANVCFLYIERGEAAMECLEFCLQRLSAPHVSGARGRQWGGSISRRLSSLHSQPGLSLQDLKEPAWKQWREFVVKYLFLPYQLIAEFAWDWLEVHYWTSRFIIVNAMLLSVLELLSFWRLWSRRELK